MVFECPTTPLCLTFETVSYILDIFEACYEGHMGGFELWERGDIREHIYVLINDLLWEL
jgi:hypothetical protein